MQIRNDRYFERFAGAGGGELSDVDEDEEEDEESQLAKLAGLSLGASDADTATGLKPPPTAYTALQVRSRCTGVQDLAVWIVFLIL